MKNFISVVIPTFNRGNVIERAVYSVLRQTYKNYEIIICDDCSSDNTKNVVCELMALYQKIHYFQLPKNSGPAAARNLGIKNAKGDYIAFLDSDNEWLPKKLEIQLNFLSKSSNEYGLVYTGNILIVNGNNKLPVIRKAKPEFEENSLLYFLRGNLKCSTSSLLIKRSCLEDVGYFNSEMRVHEDRELLVRILLKYKILTIPDPFLIANYYISSKRKALNQLEHALKYELNNIAAIEEKLGNKEAELFRSKLYIIIINNAIREHKYSKAFSFIKLRIRQKHNLTKFEYIELIKSLIVSFSGDSLLPFWHLVKYLKNVKNKTN